MKAEKVQCEKLKRWKVEAEQVNIQCEFNNVDFKSGM